MHLTDDLDIVVAVEEEEDTEEAVEITDVNEDHQKQKTIKNSKVIQNTINQKSMRSLEDKDITAGEVVAVDAEVAVFTDVDLDQEAKDLGTSIRHKTKDVTTKEVILQRAKEKTDQAEEGLHPDVTDDSEEDQDVLHHKVQETKAATVTIAIENNVIVAIVEIAEIVKTVQIVVIAEIVKTVQTAVIVVTVATAMTTKAAIGIKKDSEMANLVEEQEVDMDALDAEVIEAIEVDEEKIVAANTAKTKLLAK